MEQYEKPNMDLIVLDDDVIITSTCCHVATGAIELPELP